ncbi:MAG TPA: glycosyltransferase [Acidimicrobiales bacterium]|nr:glycosyltransferase [Acidimicrobiales bacterium]
MTAGWVVPAVDDSIEPLTAPPTFSVVIPVYQAAHVVGEAIESVLAQTVPPCEIIVCDDGSSDDLVGALAKFEERITLLRQEHKGVAAARNLALRCAKGEFLVGCDADDVLLPRCIEALGELASARPDLDILVPTYYYERGGEFLGMSTAGNKPEFPVDDLRMGILRDSIVPIGSGVRRLRLIGIGGFDETLRCAEDYDVWVRLILAGSRAGLLLEPLWVWRLRGGSLSDQGLWCVQGSIQTLTKVLSRSDVSEAERAVVGERLASLRRDLAFVEAKAALVEGRPDARRRCLEVVVGRGQGPRARVRAAVAAVNPKWAGRRIETRSGS